MMPDIEIRIERPNRTGRPDVHIVDRCEKGETVGLYYSYVGIHSRFKRWIEPNMIRCIVCSLLSDMTDEVSGPVNQTHVEVKATEFGTSGIRRVGTIYRDVNGMLNLAVRTVGTDHGYYHMSIGYGDVKCFLYEVFTTGRVPELGNNSFGGSCVALCRPGCRGLPFLQKAKAPS
ncbi:MAG: hypothetical protein WCJ25_05005 [Candidatus Moraniibacteriota bacterium]